jgi:hypothetical protein
VSQAHVTTLQKTGQAVKAALSGSPVVTVLLAALTTLAALLTAFGGADVARRNHQGLLYGALLLVLLAFLSGALAALFNTHWLAGIGMILLVAGLGAAGWATLDHQAGRPLLSASLIETAPAHIEATIKRDGLGTKDQMEADVEGYTDLAAKTAPVATLYRASFGPDEDGKVDFSFQVPVPKDAWVKSVLLRTWVARTSEPQNLSCTSSGVKNDLKYDLKYEAACVLIVLPGS